VGEKRRWTSIQTERVLLGIIAQGRLSKRRLQIAAAIISDSWAHYRKGDDPELCNWTRDPMPVARICRLTGLDHAPASRELRAMIAANQVHVSSGTEDQQIRLSFNEHFDQWIGDETSPPDVTKRHQNGDETSHVTKRHMCQNVTAYVTKRHQNGDETSPPHIISPHLETTKNKRSAHAEKRAPRRDSTWDKFAELYRSENGCAPTPKKAHFVNLAELRRHHPEPLITQKLAWYFAGSPAFITPPHDFGGFCANFDRISENNRKRNKPESPVERLQRMARVADATRSLPAGGGVRPATERGMPESEAG
jgi:hypothetical protein